MNVCHWVVYDVVTNVFDDFVDTNIITKTQLKEIWIESYKDNQNRSTVRIEQWTKCETCTKYEFLRHIKQTQTNLIAERLEDNLRFIKFAFPPTNDLKWKGNIYINSLDSQYARYKDWQYTMIDVNKPQTFANQSITTTTIIQNDYEDLLTKIYSKEVYGKGIGLVSLELIDLETQNLDATIPFIQRAEKGVIINKVLHSWGN